MNLDCEGSQNVEDNNRDKTTETEEDGVSREICLEPELLSEWSCVICAGVIYKRINVDLAHDHGDHGVESVDHVRELRIIMEHCCEAEEESKEDT